LGSLFASFLRLGAVSFGGPAMVAYIRQLAVERKGWLGKDDLAQGVALCQAVPGATAMQCAAYVGLRSRGLAGAVAAYAGFGLPAFLLMLALASGYRHAVELPAAAAALVGLRALVVALVANAAWTFGRTAVRAPLQLLCSAIMAGMFLAGGNPFILVVVAGLAGTILFRHRPETLPEAPGAPAQDWHAFRAPVVVLLVATVLVSILIVCSPRLASLCLVMMRVDLFAFGGGFASVPLMLREIVQVRGWLPAETFMDGIALGQVTPGPIVITATFVGYQVAGLPGALAGTAGIFLPSLFVVTLAEPWFRRLRGSAAFQGATQGLVLSFVGLLASVTVQFGRAVPWGVSTALLAAGALVALRLRVPVYWVVLAGATVAVLVR
jgi:chromate transporter